jgi:hypothetical protein
MVNRNKGDLVCRNADAFYVSYLNMVPYAADKWHGKRLFWQHGLKRTMDGSFEDEDVIQIVRPAR